MNLDKGICTIFRKVDTAEPGSMPSWAYTLIYQSWYGEPSFETSPAWPTEKRKEIEIAARIRVLQNREIKQNDVVILLELASYDSRPADAPVYSVTRAYHGLDDDGPTLITDLTLEVAQP